MLPVAAKVFTLRNLALRIRWTSWLNYSKAITLMFKILQEFQEENQDKETLHSYYSTWNGETNADKRINSNKKVY